MKKHTRIYALILALSMMLFAGCGNMKKTYSSVEEWYDENPMMSSLINAGVAAQEEEGDDLSFRIEGNTVVYGAVLEEKMYGESAELDQAYNDFFDAQLETERTSYLEVITDMAELSGIPESSISVRIEFYEPEATTPCYTKTFTK